MSVIPQIVFVVPYRDRPQHKYFFSTYIQTIMEQTPEVIYEVYFSHQCDNRSFNRGGTKNIGFIAIRDKYPNHYQNITFVFNDVDTMPFTALFDYKTVAGTVKHFYGFKYALGGIVSITGSDFERTNGFPNFWGWGMEDNAFQTRCERIHLKIDRNHFYKIGSPQMLQLFDGMTRVINRADPWRATYDNGIDGIRSIHKLKFTIDAESKAPADNIHLTPVDKRARLFVVNIDTFMTYIRYENEKYTSYDLREPRRKIVNPAHIRTEPGSVSAITDDWTNFPHYTRPKPHRIHTPALAPSMPPPMPPVIRRRR